MAQVISLAVYEIQGIAPKTSPVTLGFSTACLLIKPYDGSNVSLNATIETIGRDGGKEYSVTQTVAQVIALANA